MATKNLFLEGTLSIHFKHSAMLINVGEMFVVPKGAEHKLTAEHELKVLFFEPRSVFNTGISDAS